MDKTEIVEVESFGEIVQHVIIDKGNGEFVSMLKSVYDEQQANQLKTGWVEPQLTKF